MSASHQVTQEKDPVKEAKELRRIMIQQEKDRKKMKIESVQAAEVGEEDLKKMKIESVEDVEVEDVKVENEPKMDVKVGDVKVEDALAEHVEVWEYKAPGNPNRQHTCMEWKEPLCLSEILIKGKLLDGREDCLHDPCGSLPGRCFTCASGHGPSVEGQSVI